MLHYWGEGFLLIMKSEQQEAVIIILNVTNMKTKLLKFGMPVMAFLLAIVFAFATNGEKSVTEQALVPGYIYMNNECKQVTHCNEGTFEVCTFNGSPVYKQINQTTCGELLYRNPW